MKFVIDAQLPPFLAEWLRAEGHDAHHVSALGRLDASDNEIWSFAVASQSVIVTKDRDFADWAIQRRPAAQVVWLRFGNLPKRGLVDRVRRAWPRILRGLEDGASVVEAH